MGMIPKTVKAEQKLGFAGFSFGLMRIVGLLSVIMISSVLSMNLPTLVRVIVIVLSGIFYMILSGKAKSNPLKSFWKGLIQYIFFKFSPKTIYSTQSSEWKNSELKRKVLSDERNKRKSKADKKS